MMKKKNVVVLGKGTLAIRISEWFLKNNNYSLTTVIPVIPEPAWTDSLVKWAQKNNVKQIKSGDYKEWLLNEKNISLHLAISIFYDKIINQDFIDVCDKIINIHNGPLPRYRGVSPINWALKNNEQMHGITIHEITSGIDDGPIISQLNYSIYPEFDEVKDVYKRSLEYGWTLFTQTMPNIDTIIPRPQNEKLALYYSAKQNNLLEERRYFTKEESAKNEKSI